MLANNASHRQRVNMVMFTYETDKRGPAAGVKWECKPKQSCSAAHSERLFLVWKRANAKYQRKNKLCEFLLHQCENMATVTNLETQTLACIFNYIVIKENISIFRSLLRRILRIKDKQITIIYWSIYSRSWWLYTYYYKWWLYTYNYIGYSKCYSVHVVIYILQLCGDMEGHSDSKKLEKLPMLAGHHE